MPVLDDFGIIVTVTNYPLTVHESKAAKIPAPSP
jgi:hypothetical protein